VCVHFYVRNACYRYVPVWWAFLPPPNPSTIDWLYDLGYKDALTWMQARGLGYCCDHCTDSNDTCDTCDTCADSNGSSSNGNSSNHNGNGNGHSGTSTDSATDSTTTADNTDSSHGDKDTPSPRQHGPGAAAATAHEQALERNDGVSAAVRATAAAAATAARAEGRSLLNCSKRPPRSAHPYDSHNKRSFQRLLGYGADNRLFDTLLVFWMAVLWKPATVLLILCEFCVLIAAKAAEAAAKEVLPVLPLLLAAVAAVSSHISSATLLHCSSHYTLVALLLNVLRGDSLVLFCCGARSMVVVTTKLP
jgi:hypothetical protein